MPISVERTLFRIGNGGFAITVPKAWVRYRKLRPGDKLEIIADEDLIVRPRPSSDSATPRAKKG